MFYVYEWFIIDTNEIIYVGKGTKNRYKVKKHNYFFNEMIKRYECDSRIIKFFDEEIDAFNYEFERIRELKEKKQCICNIYNGGSGGSTKIWTSEKREFYSKYNCMKNIVQRERMSKNNPMKNPKICKKVADKIKKKIVLDGKIYEDAKEVAKLYKKSVNTVYYWIKNGITNDKKQIFYYGSTPNIKKVKNDKRNKKVLVDEIEFESVKSASNYIKVDPSILIKCLKNNKLCKNYKCRYVNQHPSHRNSII